VVLQGRVSECSLQVELVGGLGQGNREEQGQCGEEEVAIVLGCGPNEVSHPDEQGQLIQDVACLVGFRLDEVSPLVFGDFVSACEF